MFDYREARDECLDHIVNSDEDTRTSVKMYYFLMNQLKICKEPFNWELMKSKVELILNDLKPANLMIINPETQSISYPPVATYQQVYEVFDHAIRELPKLVKPQELVVSDRISEDQLNSLNQLENVSSSFKHSRS